MPALDLRLGDCLEVLRSLDAQSVDAICEATPEVPQGRLL